MWVSGSLMRSSTWRSSSVSAPYISSSIGLPSSADRSRTMRGSFCQALPIGCMRVLSTPSCNSAVTFESRCRGALNSESSWRRTISMSWLRVSTSSETMVMRCSSVSTCTRIDWLATLASGRSSSRAAVSGLSGAGAAARRSGPDLASTLDSNLAPDLGAAGGTSCLPVGGARTIRRARSIASAGISPEGAGAAASALPAEWSLAGAGRAEASADMRWSSAIKSPSLPSGSA